MRHLWRYDDRSPLQVALRTVRVFQRLLRPVINVVTGTAPLSRIIAVVVFVSVLAVASVAFRVIVGIQGSQQSSDFVIESYQSEGILGSERITFAEVLSQHKPVVLNFFGGACPPCRFEMMAFQRVSERYGEAIIVLGLDVGIHFGLGTKEMGLALVDELHITYPNGAPVDEVPVREFGIQSLPSTLFFDTEGKVFQRWEGAITEEHISSIVLSVLDSG